MDERPDSAKSGVEPAPTRGRGAPSGDAEIMSVLNRGRAARGLSPLSAWPGAHREPLQVVLELARQIFPGVASIVDSMGCNDALFPFAHLPDCASVPWIRRRRDRAVRAGVHDRMRQLTVAQAAADPGLVRAIEADLLASAIVELRAAMFADDRAPHLAPAVCEMLEPFLRASSDKIDHTISNH